MGLFALRISLQDSLYEESKIIREIKTYLEQKNFSEEEINQKVVDFYKSFGIDFSIDFVSNIQPHPIATFNPESVSSFLLNGSQLVNNNADENLDSNDDSDNGSIG